MNTVKKLFIVFLIGLYWYSQSVFSHLTVIEEHHQTQEVSVSHEHTDWNNHEHQEKQIAWCSTGECEVTCESIEEWKVTLGCGYHEILLELRDHHIEKNTLYLSHTNPTWVEPYFTRNATWPPIPIELLMPRVWAVVRII